MESKIVLYSETWTSPSNIALVKYWGKFPIQIPANPSISFTLKESLTQMRIDLVEGQLEKVDLDFYFENSSNEKFREKIFKFLTTMTDRFPWLLKYKLIIHSQNTFPHSSGIASSASSMSALGLCLVALDEKVSGQTCPDFFKEASRISRLASGSAARSVYPFMASWGKGSEEFADPILKSEIHSVFHEYCDSIVIVDAGEKSVSSRAGHSLMENHPFKEERFKRANENFLRLMDAMKKGEMDKFIEVVEEEALMLHALMMTSRPSYILLKPDSLLAIEKVKAFRLNTKIPVCFTIDAGPNIHVLYPKCDEVVVKSWMQKAFSHLRVIHDEVGAGPSRIKE